MTAKQSHKGKAQKILSNDSEEDWGNKMNRMMQMTPVIETIETSNRDVESALACMSLLKRSDMRAPEKHTRQHRKFTTPLFS